MLFEFALLHFRDFAALGINFTQMLLDFLPMLFNDLLRFGFAALYTRYVDVFDAVRCLREVLASRAWERPEYAQRMSVT